MYLYENKYCTMYVVLMTIVIRLNLPTQPFIVLCSQLINKYYQYIVGKQIYLNIKMLTLQT